MSLHQARPKPERKASRKLGNEKKPQANGADKLPLRLYDRRNTMKTILIAVAASLATIAAIKFVRRKRNESR